MLNWIIFGFYTVAILALGVFGFHKLFLLGTYRKYRNVPLPSITLPQEWPEVTVQLPIYNERYVIKRLLKAVARLDYPSDKLLIQVLDDSTDRTSELAARLVKSLQRQGIRIQHLRRSSRQGFKAGALANGLKHTKSQYIAVFDADFVPNRNFLKESIPYLMQKDIGMVQTRWTHLNRNYSLLTRLQAIFLDGHFLIEHTARHRSGRFFNFNGTAGVWKRQAIEDAGGWQHDTLTEDLDLSYRAQLAGWRFLYLPNVVSPAELPVEMNAYKSQQHRWAKGSVQTALKLYRPLLKSNLPFKIRLEAFIHLGSNLSYLIMTIPAMLLYPALKFQYTMEIPWVVSIYLFFFLTATLSVVFYYSVVIRQTLGKRWRYLIYIPLLMAFGMGLSLNNGKAALEALLGYRSEFTRTPKFGIREKKINWRLKYYQVKVPSVLLMELVLVVYFAYGLIQFLNARLFVSLPIFILFLAGFAYMSFSSFLSRAFSILHRGK